MRHEREGLLFARGNATECANAIRRLFRDPDLAAACSVEPVANAQHRQYQFGRAVETYYNLYVQLAGSFCSRGPLTSAPQKHRPHRGRLQKKP